MLQPYNTKICLVGDALSGGGAERAHALLSNYFVSKGMEVHNVVVQDLITYDYSGELLNMGKFKNSSNGVFNKLKRFGVLRGYIKERKFDYIIDFRMRRKPLQDFLISKFVFIVPTIYSVRSSFIEWYMPSQSWLTKLIYGESYGVVSINDKMKTYIERRHGLQNVVTIYNAVDFDFIQQKLTVYKQPGMYKYIIAAGRMKENVKQFDKLIEAYSKSILPGNNIHLLILGEGEDREALENLAGRLGLTEKVIFKGFKDNPYVYMQEALFFVLSSKFEGTPNVLLEALACGTPVVSFDCFTGPSEIVIHKENGLLIEDQNVEELTKGMNVMYEDKELYERCRQNAKSSVAKFSLDKIGDQWMEFLKIQNQN